MNLSRLKILMCVFVSSKILCKRVTLLSVCVCEIVTCVNNVFKCERILSESIHESVSL